MSQDRYDKLLKKLRQTNPAHDMLPVIESLAGTHIAVAYLEIALEDQVTQTQEEITLAMLHKQKSTLYSRRAVLSNKFHQCTTNRERLEVSHAIGSIQTEIIDNRRHLEQYAETGRLPKMPGKLTLPYDGLRKWKKVHSLRSSISRYCGLIQKTVEPDKIKEYERKLTRLQEQLSELSA